MKRKIWVTAGLAAALWAGSGESPASPEYRKDPAVRASVERDLKTSDPAEIRRRWGALTDLVDKGWITPRDGYRGWIYLRWVVPGAVMEFFVGFCPTSTKCETRVRQALLVHNPQASTEWSFSNPFRRPAFDVLWDNGWNHTLGIVHEKVVLLNSVLYSFHAESGQAMLGGAPYKAMPVAELAALTKYDFKSVPGQVAAVQPAAQPAVQPVVWPEYHKDPAVRAAVERDLKTTDEAEIRRRWGVFVDLLDTPWARSYESPSTKRLAWFHARWVVQGAVIELVRGSCEDKKCTTSKALLVHNPQLSKRSLWPNPYGVPGFDMLWEDGRDETLGMVYKDKDLVQTNTTSYRFSSGSGEARIDGQPYKPMPAAELAALTGYDFKAGPTQTAAAQPAAQPATKPAAPPADRGKLRAGTLGVWHGVLAEPSKPDTLQPYFTSVFPGGAAAKAGFQDKDVVQRIGDIENPTPGDLWRTVRMSPGKPLALVVRRNGQAVAGTVTPGEVTVPGPCFVLGMPDFDVALGLPKVEYDGECKDGFAHGRGAVSYAVQHRGQIETARYTGDFVNGYMEGRGTLTTPWWTYEGAFATMMRDGRGKLTYADGKSGFEGTFKHGKPVGLKAFPEAVFVCSRPDAAGNFRCDAPDRAGLAGGPAAKGQADSPQALLASVAQSCPSQRRLPSRTHLVWGCGFGATDAPGAIDRGPNIETRGRGAYQCLEREAACKRTDPIS